MKKDMFGWFVVICFLVALFIIYNDYDQANQTTMTNNFLPIVDREDLHPIVQEKTNELIEKAAEIDIAIVITDDYRSNKEQDKLYAQGRETPGPIVTNARGGQSMHNYGLAIDYALKNSAGEIIWDIEYDGNSNGVSDWLEVAEIAKDLGFSWGGDWAHFKDYPHLEITFDYTLQDLQKSSVKE